MTQLDYLHETCLYESEAKILDIKEIEGKWAIICDRTIFYPQGGGQPSDQGTITSSNGVFRITEVKLDEYGNVHHYGKYENGQFHKDEIVKLVIDANRRKQNSRLHSAGHLIDIALIKMGITGLLPTKGYHYPDGPYIQYEGLLENPQGLIPELEKTVNELVEQNIKIHCIELSREEALLKNIHAPVGKSARVVRFEGYPEFGCGGTHVHSSKEIGHITIRKISSKKGSTTIGYAIA